MNRAESIVLLLASVLLAATMGPAATGEEPAHLKWAPTPPMGWNSYDSYGDTVTEDEVLANAAVMKEKLLAHGWRYVVVDYRWYDPTAANAAKEGAALTMDEFGRLLPAVNRFPSAANGKGFKPLADRVHALGLKFGIHAMRGIPRQAVKANTPIEGTEFKAADAADTASTCTWLPDMYGVDATKPAGQAYYDSLLRLYASWEVDFIKVDDLSSPYHKAEIEAIRRAIDKTGRPIVFSTSPGETPWQESEHVKQYANMWRIGGDFWDTWGWIGNALGRADAWRGRNCAGPGRWPDADMLPIGRLGPRCPVDGADRQCRLTPEERGTLLSLWAIMPSPLMLGNNLTDMDAATLALLTNDEVIAINQDPLGRQAVTTKPTNTGATVFWKELQDGSKAVALLNGLGKSPYNEAKAIYRSKLINGLTPGYAVDIDVDISGAKKLYLVVDDAGDGGSDHADWLEPRLVGPKGEEPLTRLKWVSATSGYGQAAVGKSISGGELIVNKQKYADGIGTHSPSVIEYDLPAGYTRFKTRAGLDEDKFFMANLRVMVFTSDPLEADAKPAADEVALPLEELGFTGPVSVRDVWKRQDLGTFTGKFSQTVPRHGTVLLRLQAAAPGGVKPGNAK